MDRYIAPVSQSAFDVPSAPDAIATDDTSVYAVALRQRMLGPSDVFVHAQPAQESPFDTEETPEGAFRPMEATSGSAHADEAPSTPRRQSPIENVSPTFSSRQTPHRPLFRTPPVSPSPASRFFGAQQSPSSQMGDPDGAMAAVSLFPSPVADTVRYRTAAQLGRNRFPSLPYRILDAVGLADSGQVLAWGPAADGLVLALGPQVFTWSFGHGAAEVFMGPCSVSAVAATQSEAKRIAIGLENGLVHVLEPDAVRGGFTSHCISDHVAALQGLALAGNHLYAASVDGAVTCTDLRTLRTTWRRSVGAAATCIAVDCDDSHIAVGTESCGVVIFHTSNLDHAETIAAAGSVASVAWHPHARPAILAFASGNSLYTRAVGNSATVCVHTAAPVTQVLWSTLTNDIIVTHADAADDDCACSAVVRDVRGGEPGRVRAVLQSHSAPIRHAVLSADGATLVTAAATGDFTLRFWSPFADERQSKRGSIHTIDADSAGGWDTPLR